MDQCACTAATTELVLLWACVGIQGMMHARPDPAPGPLPEPLLCAQDDTMAGQAHVVLCSQPRLYNDKEVSAARLPRAWDCVTCQGDGDGRRDTVKVVASDLHTAFVCPCASVMCWANIV